MSATQIADRPRVTGDPEWAARGACRDVDPESLFVQGAAQHKAKMICSRCPVRLDCLAEALDAGAEFGVWGGMTERERRVLQRKLPEVASWHAFFSSPQLAEEYAAMPLGRSRSPRVAS